MTTFSKMAAISSMANSKVLYVGKILRNVLPDNTALHLNSLSIKHFVT